MRTRKKFTADVEALDNCEAFDDGFIEGDINAGRTVATFNFGMDNTLAISSMPMVQVFKAAQRGSTPAVDGELYTVKRCYQFRPSTIRKLNELKANHADINVYLNTVIDEAITHYYDFIFKSRSN